MKKVIILIVFSMLASMAFPQNFQWARKVGGGNSSQSFAIAVDRDGSVYTAGTFKDTADFDPGSGVYNLVSAGAEDIYILKLNASGAFAWAMRIGGKYRDAALALNIDSAGNIYATGFFRDTADFDGGPGSYILSTLTESCFLTKISSTGNFAWARKWNGDGSSNGIAITLDSSANIILTGSFYGTCDVDPGTPVNNMVSEGLHDFFFEKIDSAGNFIWAKQIGGSQEQIANSVALDRAGNIYLAGQFQSSVDFDPGSPVFNLTATPVDGSGYLSDIFIAKYNSAGTFIWAKPMGGEMSEYARAIAVDADNNVYTGGVFNSMSINFNPGTGGYTYASSGGSYEGFITKHNAAGNLVWMKVITSTVDIDGIDLALDRNANVYTTGGCRDADFDPGPDHYYVNSTNGNLAFILMLDSTGKFSWVKQMRGGNNASATGSNLVLDAVGNIYSSGEFAGMVDFNPDSTNFFMTGNSTVKTDVFISKLDACLRPAVASAILGGANVCPGTTQDYMVAAVAGASGYNWVVPGDAGIISGANTSSVQVQVGYLPGKLMVYPSNQCGSSDPTVLDITLKNLPLVRITAVPGAIVCEGTFLKLSGRGAVSYTWSGGISNGVPFIPSTSGSYVVTGTGSNGCKSSFTQAIVVNPVPYIATQPANVSAVANTTIRFIVSTPSTGATFRWQQNEATGFVSLMNFGSVSGASDDTLVLSNVNPGWNNNGYRCIISEGTCSDTSDIAMLNVLSTGVDALKNVREFTLYPNPASGQINIRLSEYKGERHYSISDIAGIVQLTGVLNEELRSVDLNGLAAGVYFIKVGSATANSAIFIKY